MQRVGILGSGAWATVIASLLAHNTISSCLWTRSDTRAQAINNQHCNPDYLPNCTLNPLITATLDLDIIYQCRLIIYALPSDQYNYLNSVPETTPCLIASKGLTPTGTLLSAYVSERLRAPIAVLSGPNLAKELAAQKPAASVIASLDLDFSSQLQSQLCTPYFRVYTSSDVPGVTIGGIYKNVLAIAAGLCDALALGHNAKSALITRGLSELRQLVRGFGGDEQTVYGLSGLGDLITTCESDSSRNWQYGYQLGVSNQRDTSKTVEGVRTAKILYDHAQSHGYTLPLLMEVYAVLFQHKPIADAIQSLLNRPLGHE